MKTRLLATMVATLLLQAAPARAATPFDAASAWRDFLAKTSADAVGDAYAVLGDVGYDGRTVDAVGCRTSRKALDDALHAIPVGLALHHAAMLCAGATGDNSRAEAELAVVGALSRHALSQAGRGAWSAPARVVRPEDVQALLVAAGLEERYAYYEDLHAARGYPRTVMAYDAESRTEREFRFDWIDTLAQLHSDTEFNGYPVRRSALADAFLEAWQGSDDASSDALALHEAWMAPDAASKRERLRAGAARGGVASLQGWMELCRSHPFAGCADGLVDALLPLAEKGRAAARAQLAVAYIEGLGVKPDDAAARTLIESADRTWAVNSASTYLGGVLLMHRTPWPAWLAQRIEATADGGDIAAVAIRVTRDAERVRALPTGKDRAVLESPAANGTGRGFLLLATLAEAVKSPEAAELRRRAATSGDAASQRMVALERLQSNADDAAALAMLREAAHGGDDGAARALAYRAVLAKDFTAARAWLLGAIVHADVDAILMLAGLQENSMPGTGTPADALKTYETLESEVPAARRALAAMLLEGRGVAKDVERARRLLEAGAKGGDTGSQVMLAEGWSTGRFGPADRAKAREWFERAISGGDADAKAQYAIWLARGSTSTAERTRSVAMLREAAAGGSTGAGNNLAWMLCVVPDDAVRDGRAGLAQAKRLGDPSLLGSGVRDTIAACHAAAGEFADAVRVQSLALDALPSGAAFDATRRAMQARLDLYKAGKPYVAPLDAL